MDKWVSLISAGCALFILAAGCNKGGGTAAGPCGFTGSCPSGWTKSGSGCTYDGPTATISGVVVDFLKDSSDMPDKEVNSALITIMDNSTGKILPICSKSDANGFVSISGVPQDVLFGYKSHARLAEGSNDEYLDTYRFNLSADLSTQTGLEFSEGVYKLFIFSELTKNLVSLEIFEPDPLKGVVAGTVEDQKRVRVYGVTATSDPPGRSSNYFHPDLFVPACNPEMPSNNCAGKKYTATSTTDGVFVIFDFPENATTQAPWKVTTSVTATDKRSMGSMDFFGYPNSVSLSDLKVTRYIHMTTSTVTASPEAPVFGLYPTDIAAGKLTGSTITVSLKDDFANPIAGYQVTAAASTAAAAISAVTDKENGTYSTFLTCSTSEKVTVTSYAEGITIPQTASVDFVGIQVTLPTGDQPKTGTSFTATILMAGTPNTSRTLSVTPGISPTTATVGPIVPDAGGHFTVTVSDSVAETATFRVDDQATGARNTIFIQFQ